VTCLQHLAASDVDALLAKFLEEAEHPNSKARAANIDAFKILGEADAQRLGEKLIDSIRGGSPWAAVAFVELVLDRPKYCELIHAKWNASKGQLTEDAEQALVYCMSLRGKDTPAAAQMCADLEQRVEKCIAERKLTSACACVQALPSLGDGAIKTIERLLTGRAMDALSHEIIRAAGGFCDRSPTILKRMKELTTAKDAYLRQYSVHALGAGALTDNAEVRADITAFLRDLKEREKDKDVRKKIEETLEWISEYQPRKQQVEIDPRDQTFPAVARCASATVGDLLHYLDESLNTGHLLGEDTALAGVKDILKAINQTKKDLRARIDCRDVKRSVSAVRCLLEIEKRVLAGEGNYWWKLRPREEELSDKINEFLREKNVAALAMRLHDVPADDVKGQIAVVEAVAAAAKGAKRDEKLEACKLLLAKYDAACAAVRLNCLHVAHGILGQLDDGSENRDTTGQRGTAPK
jgi:hypothetical protein